MAPLLLLIAAAACTPVRYSAEPPAFLADAIAENPPGEGLTLYPFPGHRGTVFAVAVTPDGQRAVSGSADYTLKVWDLESGKELLTRSGHRGTVRAVAVTPDSQRAVSGSGGWHPEGLGSGKRKRAPNPLRPPATPCLRWR